MADSKSLRKARRLINSLPHGFSDIKNLWQRKMEYTARSWKTETMNKFNKVLSDKPEDAYDFLDSNGKKEVSKDE